MRHHHPHADIGANKEKNVTCTSPATFRCQELAERMTLKQSETLPNERFLKFRDHLEML